MATRLPTSASTPPSSTSSPWFVTTGTTWTALARKSLPTLPTRVCTLTNHCSTLLRLTTSSRTTEPAIAGLTLNPVNEVMPTLTAANGSSSRGHANSAGSAAAHR
ncbi:hypothetical protein RvY_06262 [Ramazzottius varieornatus]|uniref:Uncharacterized protein n=1 Tax=Ramazzottius varieornatus TaxID=947166 RepID=A0A1D1V1G3_RAMVA|nr:hypothetical protein RvY_06262 [Ramazzottius varieornatus]